VWTVDIERKPKIFALLKADVGITNLIRMAINEKEE